MSNQANRVQVLSAGYSRAQKLSNSVPCSVVSLITKFHSPWSCVHILPVPKRDAYNVNLGCVDVQRQLRNGTTKLLKCPVVLEVGTADAIVTIDMPNHMILCGRFEMYLNEKQALFNRDTDWKRMCCRELPMSCCQSAMYVRGSVLNEFLNGGGGAVHFKCDVLGLQLDGMCMLDSHVGGMKGDFVWPTQMDGTKLRTFDRDAPWIFKWIYTNDNKEHVQLKIQNHVVPLTWEGWDMIVIVYIDGEMHQSDKFVFRWSKWGGVIQLRYHDAYEGIELTVEQFSHHEIQVKYRIVAIAEIDFRIDTFSLLM